MRSQGTNETVVCFTRHRGVNNRAPRHGGNGYASVRPGNTDERRHQAVESAMPSAGDHL